MRHAATSLKSSELHKTSTPKRSIDWQNPPEDSSKIQVRRKAVPSYFNGPFREVSRLHVLVSGMSDSW